MIGQGIRTDCQRHRYHHQRFGQAPQRSQTSGLHSRGRHGDGRGSFFMSLAGPMTYRDTKKRRGSISSNLLSLTIDAEDNNKRRLSRLAYGATYLRRYCRATIHNVANRVCLEQRKWRLRGEIDASVIYVKRLEARPAQLLYEQRNATLQKAEGSLSAVLLVRNAARGHDPGNHVLVLEPLLVTG